MLICLATGCALGSPGWREASQARVEWIGAGDGRCSDPAPYTSLDACLSHDAAYELARRSRCPGWDPIYGTEQSRFVADSGLLNQMAQDGTPEFWAAMYYIGVRLAGWPTWHFSKETCE